MTTQTFETSNGTLLAIRLPEGATGTALTSRNLHLDIKYGTKYKAFPLPPGDWKEIGLWGSVSEEKAKEVVDDESVGMYVDYTAESDFGKKRRFDAAIESLQSLLQTGIYLKNPNGDDPPSASEMFDGVSNIEHADNYEHWQTAEAEVWKHFYLLFKTK